MATSKKIPKAFAGSASSRNDYLAGESVSKKSGAKKPAKAAASKVAKKK